MSKFHEYIQVQGIYEILICKRLNLESSFICILLCAATFHTGTVFYKLRERQNFYVCRNCSKFPYY